MEIENLKLQKQIDELIDKIYPIGSYYETSDGNFNPNTSWGGTWNQDSRGLVTVGAYDEGNVRPDNDRLYITQGEVYGEVEHTLTVDEIPSHTHGGFPEWNIPNGQIEGIYGYKSDGSNSHSYGSTGGDQPHNNIQPSIGVFRWHRIS